MAILTECCYICYTCCNKCEDFHRQIHISRWMEITFMQVLVTTRPWRVKCGNSRRLEDVDRATDGVGAMAKRIRRTSLKSIIRVDKNKHLYQVNKQTDQRPIKNSTQRYHNKNNKQPYQHGIDNRQPFHKAQYQNGKEVTITQGKVLFLLLTFFLPFAGGTVKDFKWLPTNDTVKGCFQTDIHLVWRYKSNVLVDKIDISRNKTKHEKENVALWTPDGGFTPNRLISTDVTLEHRKEGDVGTIILTLIFAYPVDFDTRYYCQISWKHGLESIETELQSYKIDYQPVTEVVEGRPGEDVKFVWLFKYPHPVKALVFYNDRNIKTDMIAWMRGLDRYVEEEYENRLKFDEPLYKGQVEITLTLLNTTADDYNHTYYSKAIAPGGYDTISKMYLVSRPEVDYRPVSEVVEGRPGDDVKFVWIYKCRIPVGDVLFYRDEDNMKTDILFWKQHDGVYGDDEEEYEDRTKLNMTLYNDQVEITLTLLDTRVDDYNHSYYSRAMSAIGYNKVSRIYLQSLTGTANTSDTFNSSSVSIFSLFILYIIIISHIG